MSPRLGHYAFLDVLAVACLSMMALAGFRLTFTGSQWLLVAAVGVAVGIGWTVLLVHFGMGIDLVLVSLPVPYVLTAGGVALGSSGLFFGFPDADTLGDVVLGSLTAWQRLAETAPPADSRGAVMLVPYALAVILAGAAAALAVRSQRAALPLVPLVLLLLAVLVLGVQEPASVLLQGFAFGAVALLWVGHRAARIEAGRRPLTDKDADPALNRAVHRVPPLRVLSALVMVALAAVVVVPVADSDPGRPRWVLREALAPYDAASVETPLSRFRLFRDGPADSVAKERLFSVRGVPPGTVVRIAVLDRYDGERWYASNDRSEQDYRDRFMRVASTIDNPGPGQAEFASIRMKRRWEVDWLPVIGRVQGFEFYDDLELARRDAVRFNRTTGTALLPGGLGKGESYNIETLLSRDTLRRSMKPWPTRDETLWSAARFLDVPARAWSAGAESPMRGLFRIAERLRRRGRYSDGANGWETRFRPGQAEERLGDDFVFADMQVGNDEQYAATMALLANRIGIPARVVVGARVGANHQVRGKAVHAWVEVRIANGTWRLLPNRAFMSRRPPRRGAAPLPPVRLPPRVDQQPQQSPERQSEQPPPEPPRDAADEPVERRGDRAWVWWLLPLLLPGCVPALKWLRRGARRSSTPPSRSFAGAWDELVDRARDLGLGPVSGSRPRQAAALVVPLALARTADLATFAEESPAGELAEDYWGRVDDELDSLRSRVPLWRRVLAPFSLASLLRRRG